jgi:hypothetical protein
MRLDQTTVEHLAQKFCILLTDPPRQDLIDQLGNHPVNHARFARYLARFGHANDWQVYLSLTAYLR